MKYVNLVINNKNDKTDSFYTYASDFENLEPGSKVYVPFGKGDKIKEAYVFQIMDSLQSRIPGLKKIDSVDEDIVLNEEILETCTWMKNRYFCRYIDALQMFLPSGTKAKRRKKKEPLQGYIGEEQPIEELTEEQNSVLNKIYDAAENQQHKMFLLHGVTGSGKTEVYMKSAQKVIEKGKKVIVLVPEVSLTKQIIDRFICRFGRDKVAVMHSKLTPGERYDQWEKIRKGDCDIVIGARSAVFAPVENIGLIVIDEEHESSYKSDQTPKYDTVEIAAKRTTHYNGIVLMGSATPSITSLKRCEDGIYEKLYLSERYNKVQLPEVHIADMREELKRGNRSVFSRRLYDEIENCLKNREQVILFINKRGHSSFVSCRSCGYVVKCEKCQLPMTYHKDSENMVCHYCGRRHDVPKVCPECKSPYIKFFGAGTERVLEEIQSLMPDAKAAKIDFDESKVKGAIEETLDSFGKGEIDILVGTQLVGKGLDFKNVGLVGIVAIDMALNLPDYRSSERVFQMITQAAGRAGRGDKRGRVIVQTYEPENFAVTAGAEQDIEKFFKREIFVRKMMDYPPFGNFTRVSVMAHNMEDEKKASELWLSYIEKNLGKKSVINIKRENKHTKKNGFRTTMLLKYSADKRKVFSAMAKEIKEKLKASRAEVSSIIDINPNNTWRN